MRKRRGENPTRLLHTGLGGRLPPPPPQTGGIWRLAAARCQLHSRRAGGGRAPARKQRLRPERSRPGPSPRPGPGTHQQRHQPPRQPYSSHSSARRGPAALAAPPGTASGRCRRRRFIRPRGGFAAALRPRRSGASEPSGRRSGAARRALGRAPVPCSAGGHHVRKRRDSCLSAQSSRGAAEGLPADRGKEGREVEGEFFQNRANWLRNWVL